MQIYLAFYKHKRERNSLKNFFFRLFDDTIRLFTHGKYSHCEIAMQLEKDKPTYLCYSSSNRDGGVRFKSMELPNDKWDLVELNVQPYLILEFFKKTKGKKYDLFGALGVVLRFGNSKRKYFCSEWCAEALGFDKPYKYSPNSLYRKVKK